MKFARLLVSSIAGFTLVTLCLAADDNLLTTQSPDGEIAGWKSFSETPAKTGDVWRLGSDGVLGCKGNPLGYLYTAKDYADFKLTLEWRWPPGGKAGKGGVLIRMTGTHQVWPCSLEAQLNAGGAGDFWALGGFQLGGPEQRMKMLTHPKFGLLRNLPRLAGAEKPVGEWNTMEVTAKGGVVVIKMNGEDVNQCEGCSTVPGPILLTSEGTEIHYRNVRLCTEK